MATMSTMLTTPSFPIPKLRQPRRSPATAIRSTAEGGGQGKPASGDRHAKLDRRNLLLGLGGMYGAATVAGGSARGDPIQPPDLNACHTARYPDGYNDLLPFQCCPPFDLSKPLDLQPYQLPKGVPLRVRKPAHKLTKWEQDRFRSAVAEMKKLPSNHPWNFMQQAQIHCTYCNDAYDQKGFPGIPIQVHFTWIFAPWHRWYLYFFERILGKIVDDETLALPFWNYDAEDGMKTPEMYKDVNSSLYNPNRNMSHRDQIINLNYTYDVEDVPLAPTIVQDNLSIMAAMFDEDSLGYPALFMGDKVVAGDMVSGATAATSMGRLENVHNVVHSWVGQAEPPNLDMGSLHTSARDLLFWAHHTNVDRLWYLYQAKRNFAVEFNDSEWLDSTFVFFDENQKIVTVKLGDTFDVQAMGFKYEDAPIAYMTLPQGRPKSTPAGTASDFGPSPRPLDSKIKATVKRPKASRSAADKAQAAEVLVVENIEMVTPDAAAFDVYVSSSKQDKGELVGTYTRIRHTHVLGNGERSKLNYKLGITGVVERIGADKDGDLVVTLVPRTGNMIVGGIHIELAPKQKF